MKQFGTILKFELSGYLKNKVFVGVTVFLVVVLAAVLFFPRVKGLISGSSPNSSPEQPGSVSPEPSVPAPALPADVGQVVLLSGQYSEVIPDVLRTGLGYTVKEGTWSSDEIRRQIGEGSAACAMVFDRPEHFTYYVENVGMYDDTGYALNEAILNGMKMQALMNRGMSADEAAGILSMSVSHDTEILGKDQMNNFFYTYAMIFALYMVMLLYGQMVASNVASEKSSRAMELLVTSAKPTAMMFGKVIASCLAGLLQLVCVFGAALLFYRLNEPYWSGIPIIGSLFNIPTGLLLYMLLFFLLGFLLYAFLYGAVGSTATKLEDINTSVMPITMVFLASFFIVIFSMASGNTDSQLMKVASFVPFTSPMAMFTRIAMSTVPAAEIVISVAILAASVVGVGILSARIYRAGVLMYGQPPKIGEIFKMMVRK